MADKPFKSSLSGRARGVLARFGIKTPDQLLNLDLPPIPGKSILKPGEGGPKVQREIVGWARDNGVQFGPSPEWLSLFDDAVEQELSPILLRALWICAIRSRSPGDIPSEDVIMYPAIYGRDKTQFRAWAARHTSQFGLPKLEGLSDRTRKRLRRANIGEPHELARLTRKVLRSKNGTVPWLEEGQIKEVERWLDSQGLTLTATSRETTSWQKWVEDLSVGAQRLFQRLGICDETQLRKWSLSSLVEYVGYDISSDGRTMFIQMIVDWARPQGIELRE